MSYFPSDKWLFNRCGVSLLVDKRATALFATSSIVVGIAVAVAASLGSSRIAPSDLLAALMGQGDVVTAMILNEIRLPRIVATLAAGFALGLAGCISQTIFHNRLATPDVLGLNEGATLAIVSFVLFTTTAAWPFWLAPIGALLAVGILYGFCAAHKDHGAMLLVSGLCLTEFLRSIVEFTMSMGALHEVQGIYVWLQGSFVGQGYATSLPVLAILVLSVPVQFYLARNLEVLRLQPPIATGLGMDVPALRLIGIVTIAVLAALGASIGGPVAFIAMAAPILVAMIVKARTPGLWCAGLFGAGLLLLSDTLARMLAEPQEIPSGVVTRILGGGFLLALLIRDGKRPTHG